jgi:hypothetical protein
MSILATRTRPAGVTGLVKGVAGNSCELGFQAREQLSENRSAHREQLNFGAIGDQPLDGIEDLDQMCPVGSNRGHSDGRPSMQLEMINFGDAEFEALADLCYQRADQRALLLQRMHIAEQQVELQRTHPHGHGHSVRTGRPDTH